MSPKLEIHRKDDNHKTYFLHKYHRCPKEVKIMKAFQQTLFKILTYYNFCLFTLKQTKSTN